MWAGNSLELPTFLTIIVLSLGLTGPIIAAFSFVDDLAVVGTNTKEIADILDAPELVRPSVPAKLRGNEIVLKDVSFAYNKQSGEVLHGIDLDIKPNTVTALVGPSGSGKSTIAKLIAGFWDVSGGSVSLGGVDLRKIPLEQLNTQIAYVSQDNYLFNTTVRENIRMGRKSATDGEIEAVAKRRAATDLFALCRKVTIPFAAAVADTFRAVKNSVSPSPAPCSKTRPSSFSMKRPQASIPKTKR